MNRLDFLTMREQVMENIDCIVDEAFLTMYGNNTDESMYSARRDELVNSLCNMICETMDPTGLSLPIDW